MIHIIRFGFDVGNTWEPLESSVKGIKNLFKGEHCYLGCFILVRNRLNAGKEEARRLVVIRNLRANLRKMEVKAEG